MSVLEYGMLCKIDSARAEMPAFYIVHLFLIAALIRTVSYANIVEINYCDSVLIISRRFLGLSELVMYRVIGCVYMLVA